MNKNENRLLPSPPHQTALRAFAIWGQEEEGATEDEMAGWHHRLDGHELK